MFRPLAAIVAVLACVGCPSAPPPPKAPGPTGVSKVEVQPSAEYLLRKFDEQLTAGKLDQAAACLDQILLTSPDHLEAWVARAMLAERRKRADAAAQAWDRVEKILVYRGKLRPFQLKGTVLEAARHYLEADRQPRAAQFLDEIFRRFPTSDWAARARLLQAEIGASRSRWTEVINACGRLSRTFARHPAAARCEALLQTARRMRDIGPLGAGDSTSWTWEWPRPQGNTLHGVWAGRGGERFAVGEAGTILHAGRDGRFSPMKSPTRWTLRALAGVDAKHLYAVGDGGVVIGFDGKRWSVRRAAKPAQLALLAAYAPARGELAAVGTSGRLLRLSGARASVDTISQTTLRGLYGFGSDQLVAVGGTGTVLRYDGKRRRVGHGWQLLKADCFEDLWSVWGRSPTELIAVGNKRTAVHVHGKTGKEEIIGLSDLRGVWGDKRQAWAVGNSGAILRYDGKRWRPERSGTLLDLHAVAGDGKQVWAVGQGGAILRRSAGGWSVAGGGIREALVGVAAAAGQTYALGERGTLLVRTRAGRWDRRRLQVGGRYLGLWADGQQVAAVGRRGLLALRRGATFERLPADTAEDLAGVWGWGGGLVVVGTRGTILRVSNGRVSDDHPPSHIDLYGVSGTGPGALVAVGDRGVILRFDGTAWREEQSGALTRLRAVWASAALDVAVGDDGTVVMRKQGGRWLRARVPTSQNIVGVWGAGPEQVYAVTERGTGLRFDGQVWTVEASPAACLRAVGGSAKQGVFAVGCHGAILRAQDH